MEATLKALISFMEVFFLSIGLVPVDMTVNYGGEEYVAPEVNTPLYIVEDGESGYYIVTADNHDECIDTAAEELQTYIEKISGAKLGIVPESALPEGADAVYLGETALSDTVDFDYSSIKEDGFLLYSDGENFIIRGEDSRGTLFGVYTFLEEYLGVRWFTPTLERVPESDDVVIDKALSRVVEPSFAVRRNDTMGTNEAYRARTRMNVSFHKNATKYGGTLPIHYGMPRLLPLFPNHFSQNTPNILQWMKTATATPTTYV